MCLLDRTTASKGLPNKEQNHMNINDVRRHTQLLSVGYYNRATADYRLNGTQLGKHFISLFSIVKHILHRQFWIKFHCLSVRRPYTIANKQFSHIHCVTVTVYSVRLLLGTHTRHLVWLLTKLTRPNWILQDRIKIMIFYIINAKIHINILLSLTFII